MEKFFFREYIATFYQNTVKFNAIPLILNNSIQYSGYQNTDYRYTVIAVKFNGISLNNQNTDK